MLAHIRTVIIVTIVTVLIWVFAESETLQPSERSTQLIFQVEGVQVERGATNRVLDVVNVEGVPLNEPSMRVTLYVEGAGPALKALDDALRPGSIELRPGMPGLNLEAGVRDVRLVEVLRRCPQLADVGVTIIRTEPEFIRVQMDELVTRRLRVEVPTLGGEADGLPEARPADVEVTLTKAQSDSLGEKSSAIARIDAATWSKLVPGQRETVAGVRVELPPELAGKPHVKVIPAAVDVGLTVKTKTASVKLNSVPVSLRIAPAEINNWRIEIPQSDLFLTDVTVNGPAEYVSQIANESVRLVAEVPLTFEELEKKITAKEVVFVDLPPGVKVDVANRTVRLTITPREPEKKPGTPSGNP